MPRAGETVVVFSGGGTGGHLYPALALAEALRRERPGVRPFFVGASRGIEARVLPDRGVEHLLLPVEGFQRTDWRRNRTVVPNLLRSLGQVGRAFRELRPGLAVVTGGYAGGPAGLTAAAMGVPLALQEQNAVPGVTTRALSLAARQIHVAFPEARERLPRTARERTIVSGNPVRPPEALDPARARERLGLPGSGPILLVVGGSQGSLALNQAVLEMVGQGGSEGLTLLWSTGPRHLEGIREGLRELGEPGWVRAVPYIDDMPAALAVTDLAVSRAGAMATSEFLAWGVPAVLVPLPTAAEDHQTRNAEALEAAGAAVHVPQAGLTGAALWDRVRPLLESREEREAMARRALERGRPEAAHHIALALAALLDGGREVRA